MGKSLQIGGGGLGRRPKSSPQSSLEDPCTTRSVEDTELQHSRAGPRAARTDQVPNQPQGPGGCPVAQSSPTLCDPMGYIAPGLPIHHQLLESTQTQAH